MPENNLLRTFICIEFPDEVIKEVARIQSLLEKQNFLGKITELKNLHLTLKFLGEISEETLEKVKVKLSTIKFSILNLQLGAVGTFNFRGSPKIVWIKVEGNVFPLQKQTDETLSDLFSKEERFMSHLTIARIKYVKDKKDFINSVSQIKCKKIKFSCNDFKLKLSELKPEGSIYTTLASYEAERI